MTHASFRPQVAECVIDDFVFETHEAVLSRKREVNTLAAPDIAADGHSKRHTHFFVHFVKIAQVLRAGTRVQIRGENVVLRFHHSQVQCR